jgi:hypothetical protein
MQHALRDNVPGMDVVDSLYSAYGNTVAQCRVCITIMSAMAVLLFLSSLTLVAPPTPSGEQPDQDLIYSNGWNYLQKSFPLLSYITSVTVTIETP